MELVVGRVASAHGITGELVIDVRTDEPDERFAPGNRLWLKPGRGDGGQEVVIESARPHGGRLLVRLPGVSDRNGADALRGHLFVIDSAQLPPIAEPDEFYDHQLEGLSVRTVDGEQLGSVTEVLHTAAGELLSVRTADGREVLVPFVSAIVKSVSLTDRLVEIDPPEGLLDLDDETR